jgi:hypothetical protein
MFVPFSIVADIFEELGRPAIFHFADSIGAEQSILFHAF